ncbi:hypothetical protein [Silicimonas sp. MF1-12-2]|uniref:hypothetical protein n=1 Tax=Silicimonas sp. MF1-12-2 TaxID=3384793 RepID=UPI0039B6D84E
MDIQKLLEDIPSMSAPERRMKRSMAIKWFRHGGKMALEAKQVIQAIDHAEGVHTSEALKRTGPLLWEGIGFGEIARGFDGEKWVATIIAEAMHGADGGGVYRLEVQGDVYPSLIRHFGDAKEMAGKMFDRQS